MEPSSLINQCFEKKILLNKELLEEDFPSSPLFASFLNNSNNSSLPFSSPLILNKDNFFFLEYPLPPDDLLQFDKYRVALEKNQEIAPYSLFLENLKEKLKPLHLSPLKVLISHQALPKKYEPYDFTRLFISRYKFLENLLRHRQELSGTLSISRILGKKEKETLSLIGLVSEINSVPSGNLIFTLEDFTGQIKVIINKNKTELYSLAREVVLDEAIAVIGTNSGNSFFAEQIIWPEVPANSELKKGPEEIYALFLSDFHVGSNHFLAEEFNKFLSWLRGETGSDSQKDIAQKVKYLFVAGDLVDGVGIYPGQDEELAIKDIYQQVQTAAELLKKIPSYIQIILCPGNHDPLPLAEPQPPFNPRYIKPLLGIPNLTLVSNPSLINIGQTENFPGFDILLYHGYSFDYYVANVDSIRAKGGYTRADLIMKFLLKRRHLAPSFGSTPYFPSPEDHLLIKQIPDFFITGHIHYSIAANYRGVTLISGSCWQSKTAFQEKVGHEPQPARVPIVNLKTREIKILKFM